MLLAGPTVTRLVVLQELLYDNPAVGPDTALTGSGSTSVCLAMCIGSAFIQWAGLYKSTVLLVLNYSLQ